MCMYPCAHAVRLKYNGFKAPVFVVRAFVVRMMSAWCAPSASEHVPIRTVAAELFYLNHIRSQAASAFGSQGRCSGPSAALCKSGAQVLLGFVMGMIMLLTSGLQYMVSAGRHIFELLIHWAKALQYMMGLLQYVLKVVLDSTPSVLEIGAGIFLVDNSTGCDPIRQAFAAFILFLAVCKWHVPAVMPHHYVICRFLSAACMQAFYPGSMSLRCVAFADPTFGKRAQVSAASSSHETESGGGASEHTAVSAVDRISLDAAIAKLSSHGGADELGGEILAAAIALRDSRGRDRLSALRNIAGTWNVARREKGWW